MFDIDLLLLMTGIMLFAWWANYVMGTPLADDQQKVDVGAIMFMIPLYFAMRRLKCAEVLDELQDAQEQQMALTTGEVLRRQTWKDHKRELYVQGREFFTWERSFLCPVCLHFWLSVVIYFFCLIGDCLYVCENTWLAIFYYLANHFIIRKI